MEEIIAMAARMKNVDPDDLTVGFKEMLMKTDGYARVEKGSIVSRQIVALAISIFESIFGSVVKRVSFAVSRNAGETTLNGREYLLDDKNNIMVFNTVEDATGYLVANGINIDEEELMEIETYKIDDTARSENV